MFFAFLLYLVGESHRADGGESGGRARRNLHYTARGGARRQRDDNNQTATTILERGSPPTHVHTEKRIRSGDNPPLTLTCFREPKYVATAASAIPPGLGHLNCKHRLLHVTPHRMLVGCRSDASTGVGRLGIKSRHVTGRSFGHLPIRSRHVTGRSLGITHFA